MSKEPVVNSQYTRFRGWNF